jgi:hypothetical protein
MKPSKIAIRVVILVMASCPIMMGGCARCSWKSQLNALPPKQTCKDQDGTHQLCVTREDGMSSGAGGNWSGEYFIKSQAPAGYELQSSKFNLYGLHMCGGDDTHPGAGSWAKCRLVTRDNQQVVWAYAIQGLSENGGALVEAAELTAVYVKSTAPPSK